MIRHCPSEQHGHEILVDGVSIEFSFAPHGIKVSTYTYFLYSI